MVYFGIALLACTCVVCCCGVVHDGGDWAEEPEFLKGGNDDYRAPIRNDANPNVRGSFISRYEAGRSAADERAQNIQEPLLGPPANPPPP